MSKKFGTTSIFEVTIHSKSSLHTFVFHSKAEEDVAEYRIMSKLVLRMDLIKFLQSL